MLGVAHACRRIKKAQHADGRIDAEARGGGTGAVPIALQAVIGDHDCAAEVVEKIANALTACVRHNAVVPGGDGLDQDDVEETVELEEIAVHRFDRIVGFFIGLNRRRIGRVGSGRTGGKRNRQTETGDFDALAKGSCNQIHYYGPLFGLRKAPRGDGEAALYFWEKGGR